jgi:hypothetical protein
MALASFWADNTQAILAAEERLPSQCYRLRYEDLVADPERTAASLFEFLGVAAVPGISEQCFSAERERSGPADHKIWYTSEISADSVGRGWSMPTEMIAPPLLAAINEMAAKLGYLVIDGAWGTTEPPADLRVPITAPPAGTERDDVRALDTAGNGTEARSAVEMVMGSENKSAMAHVPLAQAEPGGPDGRWGPHSSETFIAVAVTKDPDCPAEYWRIDLDQATVTQVTKGAQDDSDWDMIGTLEAWEMVIDRQVNLSVALRSCALRYCDNDEPTPLAADTRIGIVGQLLGLANWL